MRHRNMDAGITNIQFERRRMLAASDMTRDEFIEAELRDGRLENGLPVLSLFFSQDPFFTGPQGLLNTGVDNPLMVPENDPETYIPKILSAKQNILGFLANSTSQRDRRRGLEAYSAITHLLHIYDPTFDPKADLRSPVAQQNAMQQSQEHREAAPPEGSTRVDGRTDREGFRDGVEGGTV